jgi:hypothetical protein
MDGEEIPARSAIGGITRSMTGNGVGEVAGSSFLISWLAAFLAGCCSELPGISGQITTECAGRPGTGPADLCIRIASGDLVVITMRDLAWHTGHETGVQLRLTGQGSQAELALDGSELVLDGFELELNAPELRTDVRRDLLAEVGRAQHAPEKDAKEGAKEKDKHFSTSSQPAASAPR